MDCHANNIYDRNLKFEFEKPEYLLFLHPLVALNLDLAIGTYAYFTKITYLAWFQD